MREVEKITYIHTWICIAFIILTVIIMSSCGYNKQLIDLEYSYDMAIIDGIGNVPIKSWCDYENSDMIQVIDTNGRVYLTHSSNVILTKGLDD